MWLNEMYGEGVCTQRSNLVTTMESHISGSDPSLPPVNWVTLFKMLYFSVPEFLNSSKKKLIWLLRLCPSIFLITSGNAYVIFPKSNISE